MKTAPARKSQINDRLAHRPQMVYGWLDSLPPRTCEGGVPALAQGRGEYEFPVIASQFAFLAWQSPSLEESVLNDEGDSHTSVRTGSE